MIAETGYFKKCVNKSLLCHYVDHEIQENKVKGYVSVWSGKHGFELVSCDDGEDEGYDPKLMNSWF